MRWDLTLWSDLWSDGRIFDCSPSLSSFVRSHSPTHRRPLLCGSKVLRSSSFFDPRSHRDSAGRSNSPGVLDSSEVYSAALRLNESPAPASPALLVLLNTVAHSKGLQCLRWWTHSIRYSNSQRINENYCNNEKLQNYIIVRSEVQSHSIVCLHNETISSTLFIQKQHT